MPQRETKQLTGKHVLIMLLAFFGVMIAVNIYFTVVAVKSFRGEDVPRSYRQGLEYNQTLAARGLQKDAGWTGHVNVTQAQGVPTLILQIKDKQGFGISGLELAAKLRHPVDTDRDQPIVFSDIGDGRYRAMPGALEGHWTIEVETMQDGFPFKMRHELWES